MTERSTTEAVRQALESTGTLLRSFFEEVRAEAETSWNQRHDANEEALRVRGPREHQTIDELGIEGLNLMAAVAQERLPSLLADMKAVLSGAIEGRVHSDHTEPATPDQSVAGLLPQQMTNEQLAAELKIDAAGIDRGQLINGLITKRQITDQLSPDEAGTMHHHIAEVSVEDGRVSVAQGMTVEAFFEQQDRQTASASDAAPGEWAAKVDGTRTGRVLE